MTLVVIGCASAPPPAVGGVVEGVRVDMRNEVVRTAVNEYLLDVSATIERASDEITAAADDPSVRRNALLWRLNAIPAMRQACFRPNPGAAALDAWVLAAQMEELFTTGAGAAAFGAQQPIAAEAARTITSGAEHVWSYILEGEDEIANMRRDLITPWVDAHPLPDLGLARASTIGVFAELTEARGGALQRIFSMEEQVAILSAKARIYLAGLHKQIRGEAELILSDALGGASLADVVRSFDEIGDAADRAARVAEQTPLIVASERAAILADVDRQRGLILDGVRAERAAVLDAVSVERREVLDAVAGERREILGTIGAERAAVMAGVAAERRELLAGVDAQRAETLDWLDERIRVERDAALAEADRIVTSAVSRSTAELERLIDVVLIRVVLLVAAAVIAAPVVAHAYARLWPRPRTA